MKNFMTRKTNKLGLLLLCVLPFLNSCNEHCSPEMGCEDYREITVSDTKNGYAYVDLGLSVNWATQNVGATHAEDFGSYFAWAETSQKKTYNWENYTYSKGSGNMITKYNIEKNNNYSNMVDSLEVLQPTDDAATTNLGSGWRTPTLAEFEELVNGCEWEWIENINGSGKSGMLGTSKANGNTIFLPAAGYKADRYHNEANFSGHYHTATVSIYAIAAYEFLFSAKYKNLGYNDRQMGRNIRPVSAKTANAGTNGND